MSTGSSRANTSAPASAAKSARISHRCSVPVSAIAGLHRRARRGRIGPGIGCGRRDDTARLVDPLVIVAAQHAQEFEPFVIGGDMHAHPSAGIGHHLPDGEPGREHAAIARAEYPVAGAYLLGILDEI